MVKTKNKKLVRNINVSGVVTNNEIDDNLECTDTKDFICSHDLIDYTLSPPVCCSCAQVLNSTLEFNRSVIHSGETSEQLGISVNTEKTSGLIHDVRGSNLPQDVVDMANQIFRRFLSQGTKAKKIITRSLPRKSVVFACVYIAYREIRPTSTVNPYVLALLLGLKESSGRPSRSDMGKGIRDLLTKLKMSKHTIVIVEPVYLVETTMRAYSISPINHMPEVISLYNYIKTRCEKLLSSKPNSIAAALFWFWYNLKNEKNRSIEIADFAKSTSLCVNTILKLALEIQASIPYFDRHPNSRAIIPGTRKRNVKK